MASNEARAARNDQRAIPTGCARKFCVYVDDFRYVPFECVSMHWCVRTIMTTFPTSSSGAKPEFMAITMCNALPVAVTFIASLTSIGHPDAHILLAIFLVTLPITVAILYQLRSVSISLDSEQLTLGGGMYKTSVPVDTIHLDSISNDPPKGIMRLRTNGIGLPGFKLGWFRSTGGRKVFVLATGNDLLYLPTSGPYDIVLSTPQRAKLVSLLKGGNSDLP